jgi:hypothetical protein
VIAAGQGVAFAVALLGTALDWPLGGGSWVWGGGCGRS